ncbi:hypothetical protein SMICM17S_08422 [Streptomyces microflavus]
MPGSQEPIETTATVTLSKYSKARAMPVCSRSAAAVAGSGSSIGA